jgi:two-component system phosphate regulon response regulator PhoB
MKALVLIYSKDPDFLLVFGHILEAAGFATALVDAGTATTIAFKDRPLAAVLDCQHGDPEAATLSAALKAGAVAVVALLGPRSSALHLDLMQAGADRIFTRPFPPADLLGWLQARAGLAGAAIENEAGDLAHGGLVLERRTHRILFQGEPIAAPPIEFKLLRTLMAKPGTVFSRETLIRAAWPDHAADAEVRGVDVHISRLRKRLAVAIGHDVVRTVRSAGYAFAPDWESA